jgi:hypothetical protein
MSKTIADQLLDIVTAVRELPEETHQAEIRRRLADPNPTYAAPEKVREFFSRFGIRSEWGLHS